jgi:hypothetical protein
MQVKKYEEAAGLPPDIPKALSVRPPWSGMPEVLCRTTMRVWPDEKSLAIYNERVMRYTNAISGCQAWANSAGHPVSCLVPGIDWNPKTWEDC